MSSHKSCFLRMEHARVAELERELESTHCKSQGWAIEVNEARATTAERGFETAKAR